MRVVAIRVAAEASSTVVPFSGPVVESLLQDVLDVQDEQVKRLLELGEAIQRLADGPWRSGRLRLREAALPNGDPEAVRRLLERAADDFRDAIPLQMDPSFSRAQACLDLSLVLGILGNNTASRHYAEMGYLTARHEMWISTRQARRARSADPYSSRTRDQLTTAAIWFEEFELAAAMLADPATDAGEPSVADDEVVRWRSGALLDRRYLTEQRHREYGAVLPRWARHDAENQVRPGVTRSFQARPPAPWEEFWGQPESVVAEPRKPDLRSRDQVDATQRYVEEENSGLWD